MAASGKDWAAQYVLDPLQAPAPADESGPGGSIGSVASQPPIYSTPVKQQGTGDSNNPFRRASLNKAGASSHSRQVSGGPAVGMSSPLHKSPMVSEVPRGSGEHSHEFPRVSGEHSREFPRVSGEYTRHSGEHGRRSGEFTGSASRQARRKSSLVERFPGDTSVRPLEMIKHDTKAANRASHLQKAHIPGADAIDRLDDAGFRYHHEGPYDAALLARNTSFKHSPVAALASSNEEALKATPSEKIRDAVKGHRPLEGVAVIPPGETDALGHTYHYQEGTDLMREDGGDGGGYKRWGDVEYRDDDLEGVGEPAFSLQKELKSHGRKTSTSGEEHGAIELVERPKYDSRDPVEIAGGQQSYSQQEQERRASSGVFEGSSTSARHHSITGALKSRIGSLRRRKD